MNKKVKNKDVFDELEVLTSSGSKAGKVKIDPACLEFKNGNQAVIDTVVAYRAGLRSGTASTKNRSDVRGGGAKPWRQKGTGRARAGSNCSPIWRGGGIIFGPMPRDFSKKINKKVKKLALKRAFTSKLEEGNVTILDEIKFDKPKTKNAVALIKNINVTSNALIATDNYGDKNVMLSFKNLPNVLLVKPDAVNVYNLLLFDKIVITKSALESLSAKLN